MARMLEGFFVPGEPQPWPKKDISVVKAGDKYRPRVRKRDKDGKKADWMALVVYKARASFGPPIYKPSGVVIVVDVLRTKPKGNKNALPITRPDLDNFTYLPHNVLENICYEDDSQIVVQVERKRWAREGREPGLFVKIWEISEVPMIRVGENSITITL